MDSHMPHELRDQGIAANLQEMHRLLVTALQASAEAQQHMKRGSTTAAIGSIVHIAPALTAAAVFCSASVNLHRLRTH